MLIQFTVGNFLSIKDNKVLSMEAASIKDEPQTNVISVLPYNLLRTAAIYGANSSGKSNVVKSLAHMKNLIFDSVRLNDKEPLDYSPFLLSTETEGQPTFFELVWLDKEKRFRYGFEYNAERIVGEWLFVKEYRKKEKYLFIRNQEGIDVNTKHFPEGKNKEENTNDNRLFLSLVAQLGGSIAKDILEWVEKNIIVISGLSSLGYEQETKDLLFQMQNEKIDFRVYFNDINLGFKELITKETSQTERDSSTLDKLPSDLKNALFNIIDGKKVIETYSIHNKYDKNGKVVDEVIFNFEEKESSGTQKFIHIIGPMLKALIYGGIMIIDELDAKMHPLISQYIINRFNSPKYNPKNAQLIFTTHDTHLLSAKLLRRDQIWFTEKNPQEETDLYSMMDVVLPDGTKPRNDSNYEKNYINGRYGAIPFITHS